MSKQIAEKFMEYEFLLSNDKGKQFHNNHDGK